MGHDSTLHALADPTRRQLFEHLALRPCSVGELVARVDVTQPAVSQHLKVLREAGLVRAEARGNRRIYHADPGELVALRSYVDGLWSSVLSAFSRHVERT